MTPTCPLCDRPVTDATFCSTCARTFTADLHIAHALSTRTLAARSSLFLACSDLDVTITRQHRIARNVGARSTETVVPWHEKASAAATALHAVLVSWALLVVEERPAQCPQDDQVALWLVGQVEFLRHHPAGVEAVTQITPAVERASRVVDREPSRRWLGMCTAPVDGGACQWELWAAPEDKHITCAACGHQHHVEQLRDDLILAAYDQLESASVIAPALTNLDRPVTADLIRKWAERGRIAVHLDACGRPRYRVGDVLELANRTAS